MDFIKWSRQAYAQIIIAAIMAFMVVTILIVLTLPVLNGIMSATPTIVTNPWDASNLTSGSGVVGSAAMNASQIALTSGIGSSLGMLIIIILLLAALAIIVVLGLFQYFIGGAGGRQ